MPKLWIYTQALIVLFILIGIVMVLIALGVRQLLPFLPGRRD